MMDIEGQIEVSTDGSTVWVHGLDGSTVGRFSKRFGMDVHRTVADQLNGKGQCLHCTHHAASQSDWDQFCDLMKANFEITVDRTLIQFPQPQDQEAPLT